MSVWPYSTAAWQRLRLAKLADQPCCEVCLLRGRTVLAHAVDHIKAISAGGNPFPPLDELMSLCDSCHSYKTNMADRPDRNGKLGSMFKGCGVDGGPIDPHDDWFASGGPQPGCDGHGEVVGDAHHPAPDAAQQPSHGTLETGAFASRRSAQRGPASKSRTELITANHSQEGADLWV